eukprot:m.465645 g.465645  ORF g.465645 m.465645 type:complete len:133 (+) comp57050_c0_seq54:1035-1433(+)
MLLRALVATTVLQLAASEVCGNIPPVNGLTQPFGDCTRSCRLVCLSGGRFPDSTTAKTRTCTSTAWSGADVDYLCQPVRCNGDKPAIGNGTLSSCTDENYFASSCPIQCAEGYRNRVPAFLLLCCVQLLDLS